MVSQMVTNMDIIEVIYVPLMGLFIPISYG
jgi:hypothetical protein